jgi:Aerotolerance regulator N-terminal
LLSFGAPLWLWGLGVLPLIRWLHRGGRQRRAVPVPYLGLWQGSAASTPAPGERRPPDPAWRRRALLTALLLLALAEPQWRPQHAPVTVWIDDSLSMLTREAQGSRLAEGLARVRAALDDGAAAEVELRTLSDPWRKLGAPGALDDAGIAALAGRAERAGQKPAYPPPAALLRSDRRHWLVTDGTEAALLDWPDGARPERVIRVTGITRNVGLERLSARRSPTDPDRIDLLIKLTNGGTEAESRTLAVSTDEGDPTLSTQRLPAGDSVSVSLSVARSAYVRATLQPGDALAEDDRIELDLTPLGRRRVAADPACPAALQAAVAAHPALSLAAADATITDAALDCSMTAAPGSIPTIRVRADRTPAPAPGPLQWPSGEAGLRHAGLDAGVLQLAARLTARPGDAVLLAAGDEPVIVRRAGATRLLETSIDFAAPGLARSAATPLLANWMFEHLLGGALLDTVVGTDRGAGTSIVAPLQPGRDDAPVATASAAIAPQSAGRPVLIAALVVLLWEAAALWRQWARLGGALSARVP